MRFAFIFPRKCWKMLDFWCMGPMGFQPGLIARIAASVSEAWYLLFSADNPGSCAKHVFLPSSLFSFIFLSVIYIYICDHIYLMRSDSCLFPRAQFSVLGNAHCLECLWMNICISEARICCSFRVTVYLLSHFCVFRFQVVLFMFRTCALDSVSESYQKPFANTW